MDKQKRIISFLKKQKVMVATGKIAVAIRSNQWMTEKYLDILEGEGLIKKIKIPSATYWEIIK